MTRYLLLFYSYGLIFVGRPGSGSEKKKQRSFTFVFLIGLLKIFQPLCENKMLLAK
jgi:hypothetical protein